MDNNPTTRKLYSFKEIDAMKLVEYRADRNKYFTNFRFNGKRVKQATKYTSKDDYEAAHAFAVNLRYDLERGYANNKLRKRNIKPLNECTNCSYVFTENACPNCCSSSLA